ncbi:uncharacterized protein LOC121291862 isoform X2 [Carcharodon carcharias]|uniref:uncharacterized protein LOC121291862 isoform X2 n=1 Tax=Carcharodon carcharias TaxID=13397 RepID=UPI001B7ED4DB|nr:uncharacterized protein LOC121291862 isoform X2 [Carcharodon carcharias]
MEVTSSVKVDPTSQGNPADLRASLGWLHSKVLGTDVPDDLEHMFLSNGTISPAVLDWLLSGVPYCMLLTIDHTTTDQPKRRQERVIESLLSKGVNLSDSITVESLVHSPIILAVHQTLIDCLMAVWAAGLLGADKVTRSIPQLPAVDEDLQDNLELAVLSWIKLNGVRDPVSDVYQVDDGLRRLTQTVNVGSLFRLIHHYCPHLRHQVEFGIGSCPESRIEFLLNFIRDHLHLQCFLSVQDFLCLPELVKPGLMVFLVELFWNLESGNVPCQREGLNQGKREDTLSKALCVSEPPRSRSPLIAWSSKAGPAQCSVGEGHIQPETVRGAKDPGLEETLVVDWLDLRSLMEVPARLRDSKQAHQSRKRLRNSYIVCERPHTLESAQASGLPIVGCDWQALGQTSRGHHTLSVTGSLDTAEGAQQDPKLPGTSGQGAQQDPKLPGTSGQGAQQDPKLPGTSGQGAQQDPKQLGTSAQGAQEDPEPLGTSGQGAQEDPEPLGTSGQGAQEDPELLGTSAQGAQEDPEALGTCGQWAQEDPEVLRTSGQGAQEDPKALGTSGQGAQEDPEALSTSGQGAQEDPELLGTSGQGAQEDPEPLGTSGQGAQEDPEPLGTSGQGAQEDPEPLGTSGQGAQEDPELPGTSGQGAQEEPEALGTSGQGAQEDPEALGTSGQGAQEEPEALGTSGQGAQEDPEALGTSGQGAQEEPEALGTSGQGAQEEPEALGTSGQGAQEDPEPPSTSGQGAQEDPEAPGTSGQGAQEEPEAPGTSGQGAQEDPDWLVGSGQGRVISRRFTYIIKTRGTEAKRGLAPVGAAPGSEGEVPPCPSPSPSPAGVRMTSFAERRQLKGGGRSGPALGTAPAASAQQDPAGPGTERLRLRRVLEEKRGQIQAQIRALEALGCRRWQKLGRRAFRGLMGGRELALEGQEEGGGPHGRGTGRREGSGYHPPVGGSGKSLSPVRGEPHRLSIQEGLLPVRGTGPESGFLPDVQDPAAGRLPGAAGGPSSVSESHGGCLLNRLGAGEPTGAGQDTGPQESGGSTADDGNAGEWNLPEGDGRAAENSQAEVLARRRSQFLQRQRQRAEQVKLRHQQKTAARQGQQEDRRRVIKGRGQGVDTSPELGAAPSKHSDARSKRWIGERVSSAGVLDLQDGEVEQSEILGVTDLTSNRRTPTENNWERHLTSAPPPAEQTGLKLFRKPSAKSNRLILHNALTYCCLAGKANESQRGQVIEELMKCPQNQCLILFRDHQCQFRALYSYLAETEEIHRLWGMGPRAVTKEMINTLYKYNSDRKLFHIIPSKTLSASVDALTIHGHLWQSRRTSTQGCAHR